MGKNIFIAAVAAISALFVASCDDDGGGQRDLYSNIYINGRNTLNKAAEADGAGQRKLTVEEICKGDSIFLRGVSFDTIYNCPTSTNLQRYIADGGIDTVKNRIAMLAGNINGLDENPFLRPDWHFFLLKIVMKPTEKWEGGITYYEADGDTIAYIPTAQRMAIVDTLTTLFEDKSRNWDKIYKIFNDAFIFYPTTGAEYQRMLDEGVE